MSLAHRVWQTPMEFIRILWILSWLVIHLLLTQRVDGEAAVEKQKLLTDISSCHPVSDAVDKSLWVLQPSGKFSVSYMLLISELIWNSIVPLKAKVFFWLLVKNELHTESQLRKKVWNGDSECIFLL